MVINAMGPSTPEERRYAIINAIEKNEKIGYNQLQRETKIPKKTLDKYLDELVEEKIISRKKKDDKPNSKVKFTVKFSEGTKSAIKKNMKKISDYHLHYDKNKIARSNTFPHYLQEIAAEYYQSLISYVFDQTPVYKYATKQIEEILEFEKNRIKKEFKKEDKARLWNDCQEVQTDMWFSAGDAMLDAANRTKHRTRDEIRMDLFQIPTRFSSQNLAVLVENGKPIRHEDQDRVLSIKNKKDREKYIELKEELVSLGYEMRDLKIRIATIADNYYQFQPKNTRELHGTIGAGYDVSDIDL